MILNAYAKLNLGLRVVRKRDDGYHDLHTVFQQIDIHDTLSFEKIKSDINITSDQSDLPLDHNNLVYKAFMLLKDKYRLCGGLKVHIKKVIPSGAGLGGGSSNAAITLFATNHLWQLEIQKQTLMDLAAEIGSDVPFFLQGGTALGEGRGEILTPLPNLDGIWIVLICPDISVSTAWAYNQLKIALTNDKKIVNFSPLFHEAAWNEFKLYLINDFERVVFKRYPQFKQYKNQLYDNGAFYASMSGSGSSIFGFFKEKEKAELALTALEKSGLKSYICKPFSVTSS